MERPWVGHLEGLLLQWRRGAVEKGGMHQKDHNQAVENTQLCRPMMLPHKRDVIHLFAWSFPITSSGKDTAD